MIRGAADEVQRRPLRGRHQRGSRFGRLLPASRACLLWQRLARRRGWPTRWSRRSTRARRFTGTRWVGAFASLSTRRAARSGPLNAFATFAAAFRAAMLTVDNPSLYCVACVCVCAGGGARGALVGQPVQPAGRHGLPQPAGAARGERGRHGVAFPLRRLWAALGTPRGSPGGEGTRTHTPAPVSMLWLACPCAAGHLICPVAGLRPRRGIQTDANTTHTHPLQGVCARTRRSTTTAGRWACRRPLPRHGRTCCCCSRATATGAWVREWVVGEGQDAIRGTENLLLLLESNRNRDRHNK